MADTSFTGDIAYHLDLAVRLAGGDEHGQAASETAVALALLSTQLDLPTVPEAGDLPGGAVLLADGEKLAPIRDRARALALEIAAHFVSEGQHGRADAYQAAATWLDG